MKMFKCPFYTDNPNDLKWDEISSSYTWIDRRGKLIDMAVTYKYKVKIVYIEPSYKTLLQQNNDREYKVPEATIKGYLRGLEVPSPSEAYAVKYITPDAKRI